MDFHVFTIENENSYDQSAFVQKIDERVMAEVRVNNTYVAYLSKKHFYKLFTNFDFYYEKNINKNYHLSREFLMLLVSVLILNFVL